MLHKITALLYICNVILFPVFFNGVFINFGQSVDFMLFLFNFNGPKKVLTNHTIQKMKLILIMH